MMNKEAIEQNDNKILYEILNGFIENGGYFNILEIIKHSDIITFNERKKHIENYILSIAKYLAHNNKPLSFGILINKIIELKLYNNIKSLLSFLFIDDRVKFAAIVFEKFSKTNELFTFIKDSFNVPVIIRNDEVKNKFINHLKELCKYNDLINTWINESFYYKHFSDSDFEFEDEDKFEYDTEEEDINEDINEDNDSNNSEGEDDKDNKDDKLINDFIREEMNKQNQTYINDKRFNTNDIIILDKNKMNELKTVLKNLLNIFE